MVWSANRRSGALIFSIYFGVATMSVNGRLVVEEVEPKVKGSTKSRTQPKRRGSARHHFPAFSSRRTAVSLLKTVEVGSK